MTLDDAIDSLQWHHDNPEGDECNSSEEYLPLCRSMVPKLIDDWFRLRHGLWMITSLQHHPKCRYADPEWANMYPSDDPCLCWVDVGMDLLWGEDFREKPDGN